MSGFFANNLNKKRNHEWKWIANFFTSDKNVNNGMACISRALHFLHPQIWTETRGKWGKLSSTHRFFTVLCQKMASRSRYCDVTKGVLWHDCDRLFSENLSLTQSIVTTISYNKVTVIRILLAILFLENTTTAGARPSPDVIVICRLYIYILYIYMVWEGDNEEESSVGRDRKREVEGEHDMG